jgi:protein TonB
MGWFFRGLANRSGSPVELSIVAVGTGPKGTPVAKTRADKPLSHPAAKSSRAVDKRTIEPATQEKKSEANSAGTSANGTGASGAVAGLENGTGPAIVAFQTELWAAIERVKEYPAEARARRQMGRVRVGFTLKKDGLITNIHLAEASPYELLNQAAMDTLKRLGQFKAIPDTVCLGDLDLTVPLNFRISY